MNIVACNLQSANYLLLAVPLYEPFYVKPANRDRTQWKDLTHFRLSMKSGILCQLSTITISFKAKERALNIKDKMNSFADVFKMLENDDLFVD